MTVVKSAASEHSDDSDTQEDLEDVRGLDIIVDVLNGILE